MRRARDKFPSAIARLALRSLLVAAIQVVVLLTLAVSTPRLLEEAGRQLLSGHALALSALLEQRGHLLAHQAQLLASVAGEPQAILHAAERLPGAEGKIVAVLLTPKGDVLAARPEVGLFVQPIGQLRVALASRAAPEQFYTFLHQGELYVAGVAQLPAPEGGWLVLLQEHGAYLSERASELMGAQILRLAQAEQVPPISLGLAELRAGWALVPVLAPRPLGTAAVAIWMRVPLGNVDDLLVAAVAVFLAGFVLLLGAQALHALTTYSQFMRPFWATLAAMRNYAQSGQWQPPAVAFREHQQAIAAMGAAIAAKQQAEEEAKARLAELQACIDHMPAQVFIKDLNLRYRLVNQRFAAALGLPPTDIIGRTDEGLYAEPRAQQEKELDRACIEQLRPLASEEELEEREGRRYFRVLRAPIIGADGEPIGIVGLRLDITERRLFEQALLESERNRIAARMAGGLAHVFNNLLMAILGSVELAQLELERGEPVDADLQQIRAAAEKGAEISQQLLLLAGHRPGPRRPTDLNQLLLDLVPTLNGLLGPSIRLETHLGRDLPPVLVDRPALSQAIMQFALRAKEAMPEGGTFFLSTGLGMPPARAQVGQPLLAHGPAVWLSLRDTGSPIPAELRPFVFEPFVDLQAREYRVGLSLAVAYGIVRQHGGAVVLEEEKGGGNCFTIYLPVAENREEHGGARVASPTSRTAGARIILVVDDEPTVRSLAVRMLTALGYEVWSAASGKEALELIAQKGHGPDLIIADVLMPGMSGTELVRRVQQRYPGCKGLLMSGFAGELEADQAAGLPVLWKPFTMQALAAAIRQALGS